jgi:hypothetical protein
MISDQDAAVLKKALGGAAAAVKIWRTIVRANAASAVVWLNLAPAQGAGEAFVSNRSDGQVDVYYFL